MSTRREQDRKDRRAILLAALLSTLLHLVAIILVAWYLLERLAPPPPPPPEEKPVELTIVEPPPTPTPPPKTAFIETPDSRQPDQPPEHPAFESDKDTRASSTAPATNNSPLPSQEGEKSPAISFEAKDYTPGRTPRPSVPTAPPQPQTPPQPTPPPTPEPTPQPTPETTPPPTPAPRSNSDIALLEPPKPTPTPRPEPPKPQTQQPRPPTPPTQPPGYQPETRITRIQGGISTRGRASVDALGTPMGRYRKSMSDAIGSRWYFYVNERRDMLNTGTVDIRFTVQADGKVKSVKVLRNTSNGITENLSISAIEDAEIPPIPPSLIPQLQNGSIEVDFSFSIL